MSRQHIACGWNRRSFRLKAEATDRLADKRGSGVRHEPLDPHVPAIAADSSNDVAPMFDRLDRAVAGLGESHPRAAQVVQLRVIGGSTIEEIAEELDLSPGTVKREWTFAKAWLAAAMETSD